MGYLDFELVVCSVSHSECVMMNLVPRSGFRGRLRGIAGFLGAQPRLMPLRLAKLQPPKL